MISDARSCLRFRLGRRAFGVPLDQVREVAAVGHAGQVHTVPLAPPHVLGLLNLRGHVLTLLDTAALLGERSGRDLKGLALVLAPPRQNLALFVDAHVELAASGARGLTMVSSSELAARVEADVVARFRTGAEA